jgi:hypothetical protein
MRREEEAEKGRAGANATAPRGTRTEGWGDHAKAVAARRGTAIAKARMFSILNGKFCRETKIIVMMLGDVVLSFMFSFSYR